MNLSVANLVPLPVLIPLLAAAATLIVGRRPRVQRWITVFALVASLVVCVALLYYADADGIAVLQIGGWEAPIGISLVVDRLSALMLVVSAIVLLSVMLYAVGQVSTTATSSSPSRSSCRPISRSPRASTSPSSQATCSTSSSASRCSSPPRSSC